MRRRALRRRPFPRLGADLSGSMFVRVSIQQESAAVKLRGGRVGARTWGPARTARSKAGEEDRQAAGVQREGSCQDWRSRDVVPLENRQSSGQVGRSGGGRRGEGWGSTLFFEKQRLRSFCLFLPFIVCFVWFVSGDYDLFQFFSILFDYFVMLY